MAQGSRERRRPGAAARRALQPAALAALEGPNDVLGQPGRNKRGSNEEHCIQPAPRQRRQCAAHACAALGRVGSHTPGQGEARRKGWELLHVERT